MQHLNEQTLYCWKKKRFSISIDFIFLKFKLSFYVGLVVTFEIDIFCMPYLLKSRSHIACNRSATSFRPKFRVVAGRLQGGCKEVGDWSPVTEGCRDDLVARRFWLLQVKPLCDQIDRRKVFAGRRQVADRSPTGWRLIADQLQRLQTIPTQFLVAVWSPTSRRSFADRSPKSFGVSAIKNKRSRYSRQSVADRSPIGCRSLPNWSPTDCRLIADGSTTTARLHDIIV